MKWLRGLGLCACVPLGPNAWADQPDFVCGGWDEGIASLNDDSTVVTRIVFVGFPDESTRQTLPSWADTLKSDFVDYIASMSHGAQALQLSIVKRLDDSTKAWIADSSAAKYKGNWGELNRQIMQKIHDAYFAATDGDSIWKGVEEVCIYHYTCVWSHPDSCGVGGKGGVGVGRGVVPAWQGTGLTIRLPQQTVNKGANRTWSCYATGHEYGHNLGVGHTPNTDDPGDPHYVNMGRYDCMRQNGSYNVSQQGFLPYHPLILAIFNWLDIVEVTSDVLDQHVPDIRDASEGVVYRVNVPSSSQYFLLANHQGTGFDAKYSGTGLLIWHILPSEAWDLECAGGKFTSGNPDPDSGKDALESSPWNMGSSADFFTGDTLFTRDTNPHTYLYQSSYTSGQTVATPIALENIRDVGSDMVLDVYLTPKQRVSEPNGGETLVAGDSMTVKWTVRPNACISDVDVDLSTNGGSSYSSIATGVSNSGIYTFVPTVVSTQCRARVTSHDETSTDGVDASDANFTLAVVSQSSVSHSNLSLPEDSVRVNINWNTLVQTSSSNDQVRLYRTQTGGTPISPSSVTYSVDGTSHTAAVIITPCDAGYWYYEVKSVNNGVTHWSTRTTTTRFKVNACVTP